MDTPTARLPLWRRLYFQVLVAIVLGLVFGAVWPKAGAAMKPLGDGFISLIRMMIAPVIFCTVVHGIGSMRDMGKAGRIGVKALVYFEVVSTLALVIGLLAGHLVQPGEGFARTQSQAAVSSSSVLQPPAEAKVPAAADKTVSGYVEKAKAPESGLVAHVQAIIPTTFVDAFAKGDLLQVLLVSILTGIGLAHMGPAGRPLAEAIEQGGQLFFRIIGVIVYLAPIGAFGAMAYTVGKFGLTSLVNLGELVATLYIASAFFVLAILGLIARASGFSILKYLAYIRDELFIVAGTASSETVLPNLMRKMERLGASDSVVGLVVPTGYSFNLDGTNIYMTLAILFLAQATNTHLSFSQEATILVIAMLTSKGASGVSGAGFVTLAATLAIVPDIPIASLGILLGVDRFMSLCRAMTNFIGNGVATLVVARWEGELDRTVLAAELEAGPVQQPAEVLT